MRIISNRSPLFSGGGYHYGSVWPLFTGWASVAEYRYHQTFPAYANLRANALLALDGSLGHVTEVLSGDYYQPLATSSPHQIWSAAMVVSPLLRGLFGLEVDAAGRDRKSTRLNSSHSQISYAVFCLKKKKRLAPHRADPAHDPLHVGHGVASVDVHASHAQHDTGQLPPRRLHDHTLGHDEKRTRTYP